MALPFQSWTNLLQNSRVKVLNPSSSLPIDFFPYFKSTCAFRFTVWIKKTNIILIFPDAVHLFETKVEITIHNVWWKFFPIKFLNKLRKNDIINWPLHLKNTEEWPCKLCDDLLPAQWVVYPLNTMPKPHYDSEDPVRTPLHETLACNKAEPHGVDLEVSMPVRADQPWAPPRGEVCPGSSPRNRILHALEMLASLGSLSVVTCNWNLKKKMILLEIYFGPKTQHGVPVYVPRGMDLDGESYYVTLLVESIT